MQRLITIVLIFKEYLVLALLVILSLILLGFNHLFAGLEAYVATELHQFPADVRFRVIPGGFAAETAIPFRIR